MRQFLIICAEVGCPISAEKTEWANAVLIFLGILLNGRQHALSIPVDKKTKALTLLNYAIDKKKVTIRFVQQLTGTLNFICRAIVPGRSFTRGMYSKIKLTSASGRDLKSYHHTWLDKEFIADCLVWKQFLSSFNDKGICRPFVDFQDKSRTAKILNFTSDASKNPRLGLGAVFNNS